MDQTNSAYIKSIEEQLYGEFPPKRTLYVLDTRKGYTIDRRQGVNSRVLFKYQTPNNRMLHKMVLYILQEYRVPREYCTFDCDINHIKRVIRIAGNTLQMICSSNLYRNDKEIFEQLKTYMEQYKFWDTPETYTVDYQETLPVQRNYDYTLDGLSNLIYNVFYAMKPGHFDPYEVQMLDDVDCDTLRTIDDTELKIKIHPYGKWGCCVKFDNRALATGSATKTDRDQALTRVVVFEPETTLEDLLRWVTNGSCYGFFEGLDKIDVCDMYMWSKLLPEITRGLSCFELKWGG
ncbi:MAG: hypothetical protein EBU90_10245 [Proteobacteria bacterium]|nr:hypothetical protein [Pseudomonadota bacterium]NBP13789.1 hypothetical protein [bacterium]